MQEYCLEVLQSKGLKPEAEVWVAEGLRADIVCGDTIYELKKTLTRESIYQAYGQGAAYLAGSRLKRLVIVGQLPAGEAEGVARSTARNLERVNRHLTVSFIDQDAFWELEERAFVGFERSRLILVAIGTLLLALSGKAAFFILVRWLSALSLDAIVRLFSFSFLFLGFLALSLRWGNTPRWHRRWW